LAERTGAGSAIRPWAWSLRSNARAAMSFNRPLAATQPQRWHCSCDSRVRCQVGWVAMSARMNTMSCALTARPWMILPASMGGNVLDVGLGVQPYVQPPHGFIEKLL